MAMRKVSWNPTQTSDELQAALKLLMSEYPLLSKKGDVKLLFKPMTSDKRSIVVRRNGSEATIEYSDLTAAIRGLGTVLSRLDEQRYVSEEQLSFQTFGIMLDCSRNAVMKVEHLKRWLRKLALLGYNMAMLYTEDTYQIPGEPYFGYQRGAYSADELKEIDAYAHQLGIELIPCIQTLGHLEQISKWAAYGEVFDTQRVLLVDEDKTYKLIEKMIRQCRECFRSKRIHIGMDETHDLGRGRFMDKFGYERGFDIFNRHLAKVTAICKKNHLSPMIWSDMYFRMGSKTMDYYDKSCVIPKDVKAKISADVELVYWDYYHTDEEFYRDWIDRHRKLGKEPIMGSGVWTWGTLWHRKSMTENAGGPSLRASLAKGLKEFFVTMWGDDGGYCDFDSAMAGLTWMAELAYTGSTPAKSLDRKFSAICHGDYKTVTAVTDETLVDSQWLWDDPILGIRWHNEKLKDKKYWGKRQKAFVQLLATFKKCKIQPADGGDIAYGSILTEFMLRKIDLRMKLDAAYAKRNMLGLRAVLKDIPMIIKLLEKLDRAFGEQWLRRNKPQGLEVMQIRFAGLKRRYEELASRIQSLLAGKIDSIDEMENLPSVPLTGIGWNYRCVATGSFIL
jgi:hypothetical protein